MVSLSHAPPSTPSHIRCPRCLLNKEPREFKRTATLAQTRAWLNKPNAKTRHAYIGKVCNACHTKRTPSELTPSEHRKRLINEGKSVEFADMVYADRRAQGKRRLAVSVKKSRKKRYGTLCEDHVLHLNKLIATIRTRCNYHYATTHDPNTKLFQTITEGVLTQVRTELKERGKEGRGVPADWRTWVTPTKIDSINEAYANVRGELQDRVASVVLAITGDRKTS